MHRDDKRCFVGYCKQRISVQDSHRIPPAFRLPRNRKRKEDPLARKTVFVSDLSGNEIQDGKAAKISISFQDARKGTYVLDVTETEAEELGRKGSKQARRGRRPKAAA